ncbi:MAG: HAMP domain-containing protein [Myxococcales bacterium]|nr:HAMP domain-containing protein [Myxococcales bacterium]
MTLGIRSKLFLLSLGLIAVSLASTYAYLRPTLDEVISSRIESDLKVRLRLVADAAQAANLSLRELRAWQTTARRLAPLADARVTLLSADGVLRGDSEVAEEELARVENHASRPEIREALGNAIASLRMESATVSVATRYSATLRQRMLYVAQPFAAADGEPAIARLSMPLVAIDRAMGKLHLALFLASFLALAVAVVMSSAAAHLAVRSLRLLTTIATRMAQGDLSPRAEPGPSEGDELAMLGRGLDKLAAKLTAALAVRRDFVANASHELRTPLASLCSAVETLRSASQRDPQHVERFVEIIARNAERLHRLVEDLLDLSRIESPGFRLSMVALPVEEIAQHVLSLFQPRAESKQIVLTCRLPSPAPHVLGERRALEQVLSNLLDNALKYGSAASEIVLGAEVIKQTERTMLRIAVSDRGPGISAEHLPRLFERFYRVDTGRSRALGGTGLGLAIVKHLVEAMHGEVGVESTVGQGSTFWFTLPLSER